MITDQTIQKAVDLLKQAALPRRIILFGSYARGEAGAHGDLGFLLVTDHVVDRRREIVRLLRVLEPHEIPADIFVASEGFFNQWKDVPGSLLYEADKEGKAVYEAD